MRPAAFATYPASRTRFAHAIDRTRYGYTPVGEGLPSRLFLQWLDDRVWTAAERPTVLVDLATGWLVEHKVPASRHWSSATPWVLALVATGYAGHSLRRGLATTAAKGGVSERTIMPTTGHTSAATVRGYIEDGELFSDPASKYLGL